MVCCSRSYSVGDLCVICLVMIRARGDQFEGKEAKNLFRYGEDS